MTRRVGGENTRGWRDRGQKRHTTQSDTRKLYTHDAHTHTQQTTWYRHQQALLLLSANCPLIHLRPSIRRSIDCEHSEANQCPNERLERTKRARERERESNETRALINSIGIEYIHRLQNVRSS